MRSYASKSQHVDVLILTSACLRRAHVEESARLRFESHEFSSPDLPHAIIERDFESGPFNLDLQNEDTIERRRYICTMQTLQTCINDKLSFQTRADSKRVNTRRMGVKAKKSSKSAKFRETIGIEPRFPQSDESALPTEIGKRHMKGARHIKYIKIATKKRRRRTAIDTSSSILIKFSSLPHFSFTSSTTPNS